MDDPTEPTRPAAPASPTDPPPPDAPTATPAAGRASRTAPVFAALRWALTLGVTCGLAAILVLGGLALGVFGLAWIALLVALSLILVGALAWRRGMLPLAVLALALALPAAATQLEMFRIDPSFGLLAASPTTRQEIDGRRLHRGAGPVYVDLRKVQFPRGSTTRISARSDLSTVIVALPTEQCLRTTIRYRFLPTYDAGLLSDIPATALRGVGFDGANPGGLSSGPFGMSIAADERERKAYDRLEATGRIGTNRTWGLLAWGRNPIEGLTVLPDGRNAWTRPVSDPGAATLELDLAGAEQMVVRDYPGFAAPLDSGYEGDDEQVAGQRWPLTLQPPRSPGEMQYAFRSSVRTPENRRRWLGWERRMITFGKATARRYAGSCATRRELRDRVVTFETQASAARVTGGRIDRLAGRSLVPQRVARSRGSRLLVEINGLGEMKVIGQALPSGPWELDRDATEETS